MPLIICSNWRTSFSFSAPRSLGHLLNRADHHSQFTHMELIDICAEQNIMSGISMKAARAMGAIKSIHSATESTLEVDQDEHGWQQANPQLTNSVLLSRLGSQPPGYKGHPSSNSTKSLPGSVVLDCRPGVKAATAITAISCNLRYRRGLC